MSDPAVMETDYLLLHRRIERLIHLAQKHGATDDELRRALEGPLHPDRVNLPAEGRLPAIDPAPYLALMPESERFPHSLAHAGRGVPLCGAQVDAESSIQIRQSPRDWQGITTCVLPEGHGRGVEVGFRVSHVGLLIEDPMPALLGFSLWTWQGPVRELGQVERA